MSEAPPEKDVMPHGHAQAPTDPPDGARFSCERCGLAYEFVVLDDGLPGEWVDVSTPAWSES